MFGCYNKIFIMPDILLFTLCAFIIMILTNIKYNKKITIKLFYQHPLIDTKNSRIIRLKKIIFITRYFCKINVELNK